MNEKCWKLLIIDVNNLYQLVIFHPYYKRMNWFWIRIDFYMIFIADIGNDTDIQSLWLNDNKLYNNW